MILQFGLAAPYAYSQPSDGNFLPLIQAILCSRHTPYGSCVACRNTNHVLQASVLAKIPHGSLAVRLAVCTGSAGNCSKYMHNCLFVKYFVKKNLPKIFDFGASGCVKMGTPRVEAWVWAPGYAKMGTPTYPGDACPYSTTFDAHYCVHPRPHGCPYAPTKCTTITYVQHVSMWPRNFARPTYIRGHAIMGVNKRTHTYPHTLPCKTTYLHTLPRNWRPNMSTRSHKLGIDARPERVHTHQRIGLTRYAHTFPLRFHVCPPCTHICPRSPTKCTPKYIHALPRIGSPPASNSLPQYAHAIPLRSHVNPRLPTNWAMLGVHNMPKRYHKMGAIGGPTCYQHPPKARHFWASIHILWASTKPQKWASTQT